MSFWSLLFFFLNLFDVPRIEEKRFFGGLRGRGHCALKESVCLGRMPGSKYPFVVILPAKKEKTKSGSCKKVEVFFKTIQKLYKNIVSII